MNDTGSNDSGNPQKDLDWAQFEAITCGLSPDFIEVYEEFEKELPQLFNDLQAAVASSSYCKVANLAHQIKGSAANFGFLRTSQEMNTLEYETQNESLQRGEEHLAAAREAFQRAQCEARTRMAHYRRESI
ncbi:MAG: hypothetical protein C5B47_06010 [Verrucomicrobia bacterium]|nr:MAG: hypothetical protein C5B47_06010 [Verrucomicrobiota bacterium]